MNTSRILLALVGTIGIAAHVAAADRPTLDPQLEPLRPLLEKTWKQKLTDKGYRADPVKFIPAAN